MTIEKETVTQVEDLHPRRPEMMRRMTQHMLCCVYWRVAAGSCDKSNQTDAGKGGSAASPQADTESGSAQWIDYTTAFKRLSFLHRRLLQVVIEREPIDKEGGDPGGVGIGGRYVSGTDGLKLGDRELFWKAYGTRVGNYHWSVLAEEEEAAYQHMARSLGWRPPQPG